MNKKYRIISCLDPGLIGVRLGSERKSLLRVCRKLLRFIIYDSYVLYENRLWTLLCITVLIRLSCYAFNSAIAQGYVVLWISKINSSLIIGRERPKYFINWYVSMCRLSLIGRKSNTSDVVQRNNVRRTHIKSIFTKKDKIGLKIDADQLKSRVLHTVAVFLGYF